MPEHPQRRPTAERGARVLYGKSRLPKPNPAIVANRHQAEKAEQRRRHQSEREDLRRRHEEELALRWASSESRPVEFRSIRGGGDDRAG